MSHPADKEVFSLSVSSISNVRAAEVEKESKDNVSLTFLVKIHELLPVAVVDS